MLVPKDASPKDFLWHQNCPLLPIPHPQRKGRSFWKKTHGLLLLIFLHFVLKSLHFFFHFTLKPWIACGMATNLPHMTKNKWKGQLSTWQITANHKNQIEQNIYSIRSSANKCPTNYSKVTMMSTQKHHNTSCKAPLAFKNLSLNSCLFCQCVLLNKVLTCQRFLGSNAL